MGTKKGQKRKTARRAYRKAPAKRITKWTSKTTATKWANQYRKNQGGAASFQAKQKGSKWAVYAQSKR